VLELSYMMNRGLTSWVNAFEWICLSAIFLILFIDIALAKWQRNLSENDVKFTITWASLGLIIGLLGWLEFVSDILRTKNWRVFSKVSHTIAVINLWLLLPVWLLMLGMKLPKMKRSLGNRQDDREDAVALIGNSAFTAASTAVLN